MKFTVVWFVSICSLFPHVLGTITTVAGSLNAIPYPSVHFMDVHDIKLSQDSEILYVSDGHGIRAMNTNTYLTTTVAGQVAVPGFEEGPGGLLSGPRDMVVMDDSNLLVADRNNHRIFRINVTTDIGIVYIWAGNGTRQNITYTPLTPYVEPIPGIEEDRMDSIMNSPIIMCKDGTDNVYVVVGFSIRKLSYNNINGSVEWAGRAALFGIVDGMRTQARFRPMVSCAADNVGNVVVIQEGNSIRRVTPEGEVTTLVAYPERGVQATVYLAKDIVYGGNESFYFIEQGQLQVRTITLDGLVSTEHDPVMGICNTNRATPLALEYDLLHDVMFVCCREHGSSTTPAWFSINRLSPPPPASTPTSAPTTLSHTSLPTSAPSTLSPTTILTHA
jgi:hypothetical protein